MPLHTVEGEVARVLLEHGADIDARDKDGRTPALLQKLISSINMHHSDLEIYYSIGFDQETLKKVLEVAESVVVNKIRLVPFLLESGATMARIVNSPREWSEIIQIVYFVHEVSKRRNDGLSLHDLKTIRQWVEDVLIGVSLDSIKQAVALDHRKEVRNANPADLLQPLDVRISEEKQNDINRITQENFNRISEKKQNSPDIVNEVSRNSSGVNTGKVSDTIEQKVFDAVEQNDIEEMRKILSRDNRLVHITGIGEEMPLHKARTAEMAQLLLDHGANVDETVEKWEYTPLKSAVVKGYLDVVQVLLENGADVHARSANNESIISAAVFSGHSKVVQILLDHGVDVHIRDWNGNTLLHIAATSSYNPLEVLKLLWDRGAKVDARNTDGRTPLYEADTAEIARWLLDHGADVNVRDQEGKTPLYRTIMYFLEVGPRIDPTSEFYDKRHYQGIIQIIRTLMEHGARVNVEVSFAEREENNIRVLNFARNVSKRKQDDLSVENVEAIKQLVINEVGKLKTANILQALDARIAEARQKGTGGAAGGTCSKSFE